MVKNLDALARGTCGLLAARDLKAICRWRGFHTDARRKDELESFLAPRFLESLGVGQALDSLEEPWLLVLHRIALEPEGVLFRDIARIVDRVLPGKAADHRAAFRALCDGLLSRGVVLVQDQSGYVSRYESRFERLVLRLPEAHREFLPAFPAETRPGVADAAPPGALAAFCRAALLEAVRGDGPPREAPAGGLLGRVAAAIAFDRSNEGGGIRFQQTPLTDLETFVRRVRDAWSTTEGNAKDAGVRARGLRAAEHVLSHLPQGEGVSTRELSRALTRLDLRLPEEELARFCEDGVRIGLVLRGGDGAERCYAAAPAIRLEEGEAELAFRAIASGIEIDLERTGLDALLQLAAVSRVDVLGACLRLSPDVAVLGRAAPRLDSIKPLRAVRAASGIFREALARVEKRHGTLFLHDGLLLLRIEDLGFRTLLSHRFEGRVRSLEGAYMAAPLALAPAIERLARQEGYSPRRVT